MGVILPVSHVKVCFAMQNLSQFGYGCVDTISIEFMMHAGMDGKHLFEIPVQSNDPTLPLK